MVQEAFAVWNALDSPLTFVFAGLTTNAEAAFYSDPEVDENHIVFVKDSWASQVPYSHQSAIALTTLSYVKATCEIVDADIRINNDDYYFTDCGSAPEEHLGYQDLFYVLIHEIGHLTGLDHSGDGLAVMFVQDSTCDDEPPHALTPDDIEGFLSFYGSDAYLALATPPEPGLEVVEERGAILDLICPDVEEVVDAAEEEDGPKSPDCGCRMGTVPATPVGGLLLALVALLLLRRRRA